MFVGSKHPFLIPLDKTPHTLLEPSPRNLVLPPTNQHLQQQQLLPYLLLIGIHFHGALTHSRESRLRISPPGVMVRRLALTSCSLSSLPLLEVASECVFH